MMITLNKPNEINQPKKDYLDGSCGSLIQEASYTLEREQSYSLELLLEHLRSE